MRAGTWRTWGGAGFWVATLEDGGSRCWRAREATEEAAWCARRLSNSGAEVRVYLTADGSSLGEVPRLQLGILERMKVPVETANSKVELGNAELVIDAIVGYSLRGAPEGAAAELVRAANQHDAPVLALDAPTGLDTTSGMVHDPAIRAAATLTLALPKHGLQERGVKEHVGELYIGDISVPPSLYDRLLGAGAVDGLFSTEEIVRLW